MSHDTLLNVLGLIGTTLLLLCWYIGDRRTRRQYEQVIGELSALSERVTELEQVKDELLGLDRLR